MSSVDAFLAPTVTEALLAALAQLRAGGAGALPPQLAIASPWLSDVPLFPGIFAGSFPHLLPSVAPEEVATVSAVLATWVQSGGAATLQVQGYDPSDWPRKTDTSCNRRELELLERAAKAGVEVLLGTKFHAKFVLIPGLVIHGSANATYSGFYQNREQLTLVGSPPRSSAASYAAARQTCENFLQTTRKAGFCSTRGYAFGIVDAPQTLSQVQACFESNWT